MRPKLKPYGDLGHVVEALQYGVSHRLQQCAWVVHRMLDERLEQNLANTLI